MSTNNRPQPLYVAPQRATCPLCGETSYSAGGVHPQCAMREADVQRMRRVKRNVKVQTKAAAGSDVRPWQKVCPKCRIFVHVRKKVCACGHRFLIRPPAARRR
jgi:RNA polymerase subunit RPABC4/transcription elongation factor Spt4